MITLKEIDRDNIWAVTKLTVQEDQKRFVAANVVSIAQAKAQPECVPLAIYDGDTPVGFCMYCLDHDEGEYWIYRLMIDKAHQGKGYGRQAMRALIKLITSDTGRDRIFISFEPENDAARHLYESLGFVPDGRVVDGETVYRFDY